MFPVLVLSSQVNCKLLEGINRIFHFSLYPSAILSLRKILSKILQSKSCSVLALSSFTQQPVSRYNFFTYQLLLYSLGYSSRFHLTSKYLRILKYLFFKPLSSLTPQGTPPLTWSSLLFGHELLDLPLLFLFFYFSLFVNLFNSFRPLICSSRYPITLQKEKIRLSAR